MDFKIKQKNVQVKVQVVQPPNVKVQVLGPPGLRGQDGKSAYELAVLNGFIGTEIEWLESLKSNYKTYICGEVGGINGHRAVYLTDNDLIKYCTNNDFNKVKKLIGITTQASNYLDTQIVQKSGELTDSSFNFDIDLPIYLGTDGLLTQIYPSDTCIILGFALSSTKMYVNIQQLIILS